MNDADISKCLKLVGDSEVKRILKENTDTAVEYGVSQFLALLR